MTRLGLPLGIHIRGGRPGCHSPSHPLEIRGLGNWDLGTQGGDDPAGALLQMRRTEFLGGNKRWTGPMYR